MTTPMPDTTHTLPAPSEHPALPAPPHDASQGGHDAAPELNLEPLGTFKVILMTAAFVLLFLALFVLGWLPNRQREKVIQAEAAKARDAMPVVDVSTPKRQKELPSLVLPGDVRAFQSTYIYPRANGYLKSLRVDIGDRVKAGQLLAEIDSPELGAQLAAAQATLEQAKAAEGRAKDDFELAESTLARYEGFAKTGGITQQQLDERRATQTQAKSSLVGAQATVRADEANVQQLTSLLGYTKVYAPFDGRITTRNYDVGALLSSTNTGEGRELFQIQDIDTLRVFVNVPQTYSNLIKVGASAQFVLRNRPDEPYQGTIARTSNSIDPVTRTLRVEADFANTDGLLLPGTYGQVKYDLVQGAQPPFVVPTSALVFGSEGMRVAVVDAGDKIRMQPVTLGKDFGTEVEVTQGLTGNERVVANPGERTTDGLVVQIAKPSTPPVAAAPAPTTKPEAFKEAAAR